MVKYKANKNNLDNIDDSLESPEKSQDEKNIENNKKNLDNAAEVAAASLNPYAKAAGYAYKLGDKLTGGKLGEKAGSAVNEIGKRIPGGNQIQNLSNKVAESGASDAAGKAASIKNNAQSGGTPGTDLNKTSDTQSTLSKANDNGLLSLFGNKKSDKSIDTDNIVGSIFANMPKSLKIKIILIGGGVFLFFIILMALFAGDDAMNLDLTNGNGSASASFKSGERVCSESEIESKLIYVGDSHLSGINDVLENESVETVLNGTDYNWFSNSAINTLEAILERKTDGVVIFSIGLKDLNNVDNYIETMKSLISKYPSNKFYFLSINKVDEEKTGYSNVEIEGFNKKMYEAFNGNYIDIFDSINYEDTIDGITLKSEKMKELNSYIVSILKSSGNIICSNGFTGSIDETKLNGGNGAILSKPLIDVIGEDKLNEWNSTLLNASQGYYGTGLGPANAAASLIDLGLSEGFIFPYFWGGGHGGQVFGISGSWGASRTITAGGSNQQPVSSNQPSGMDCSGFVSWALNNGGCRSFTPTTAAGFMNLGNKISPEKAQAGDIAASTTHVVIIIENTGTSLKVAEAKNPSKGIVFSEDDYSKYKSNGYTVRDMSSYYANNCK